MGLQLHLILVLFGEVQLTYLTSTEKTSNDFKLFCLAQHTHIVVIS